MPSYYNPGTFPPQRPTPEKLAEIGKRRKDFLTGNARVVIPVGDYNLISTDIPLLLGEIAALKAENAELRTAAGYALEHVSELEDAWMRGCITEHDGKGGMRSNRNVDVRIALRAALDAAKEKIS